MIVWSNWSAFAGAEPGLFFEPVLALNQWMIDQEHDAPEIHRWTTSRPVMRALSFEREYRAYLKRRADGDDSPWETFEDGLFHA